METIKDLMQTGGSTLTQSIDIEELHKILALIGELADYTKTVNGVTDVMTEDYLGVVLPRRLYAIGILTRPYRLQERDQKCQPRVWQLK